MQGTTKFETVISSHLEAIAEKDPLFAVTLKKPNKNIKDCVTYILNTVKASGCSGYAEDEIFGMAVHYYDEDDIKPGAAVNCKVVVNHSIPAVKNEVVTKAPVVEKKKPVKKVENEKDQVSLF